MITQWHFPFSQRLLILSISFLVVFLLFFLHSLSTYAAAIEPTGMRALTTLERLPYLKLDTLAGGQSSFDRANRNKDHDNFLYTDANGDNVLLDLKNPGTVYRMWFTGFSATTIIKVYFDGSSTPQIKMKLSQLFDGSTPPFLPPLVGNASVSSGGFISYVPLPFHSAIKITTSGYTNYYNIGYHIYSSDTHITTWTGTEDSTFARREWSNANIGINPMSTNNNTVVSGTINLAAGVTRTLLDRSGPQEITSIKLHIPDVVAPRSSTSLTNQTRKGTRAFTYPTTNSATTDVLNNTWLRIFWDNEATPGVNAPIGSLFGLGQFGSYGTRALMMGLDQNNWLYLYFPMPFASHAHIVLMNKRSSTTKALSYEIKYKPFLYSFQNVGYFRTQFNTQQPTSNGNDILILNAQGAGQFLGEVQSMDGPTSRAYLEGNERIYIDGSNSPSFQGTGTEDFFNGGWYFKQGLYTAPMSGNTAHIATRTEDKTAAYRLFLQDAIPFYMHIYVSIQHGSSDTTGVNENTWTLAYYYLQSARAILTDTLDVGNAASETAHHYSIANQTWQGTRSLTFEGIHNTTTIRDDGRAYTQPTNSDRTINQGTSQFTMAINPNNNGVILRRRFDQGAFSPQAKIFIDGAYGGIWYNAGGNRTFRWREEDFLIPASFTNGKSSITITIKPVSVENEWNSFHFWVYCEQ